MNRDKDTNIDIHRRFVFAPVCRGVTSKRASPPAGVKNPDILNPNNPPHFPATRVQLGQDQQLLPEEQQDPEVANYLKYLIEKENEEIGDEAEDELR